MTRSLILPCCLLAAGCSGTQSALDPAGPGAARIDLLWWLMLSVCAAIFALVLAMLLWAIGRRRRPDLEPASAFIRPEPRRERRIALTVGGAVAITVLIVFLFVLASFWIGRELIARPGEPALNIEVTAQRWWWAVRYDDPVPSNSFSTANEIHIRSGGRSC